MIAEVLLDQNLQKPLEYSIPSHMHVTIGQRVEVPLRGTKAKGTICALKSASVYPVRPLLRLLDASLSESLWQLALWMSHYYCASLSRVLKCFFPPNIRKETKATPLLALDELEFFSTTPKLLTDEQAEALGRITKTLYAQQFAVHLLHGVTGSGKTEVYLQAIQVALDQGKSALMLVPEIALTTQTIERLRARFGVRLAILHHRRSLGERTAAWESLKKGEAKIAIGARSAILSPISNLGLIVIDEEHDASYKQSEEPTYHARDVAVMRAKLEQAVVILGSATPALESYYNAERGKYILSTLIHRATSAPLPHIQIIDLKRSYERNGGFTHFSQELIEAMQERAQRGEQTLLLLNRRGYHRMQICASCRHVIRCPHCDLSLLYHRAIHQLSCPLCNANTIPAQQCPSCQSGIALEFRGFGTEHVERSLRALLPSIRTLRMDRDTTRTKQGHEELFKQFKSHKADVLIGTQMIAKGLHFPSVTLVGILNADLSLHLPDLRASEQTFQLLVQIAGRAGRADLPGEVILQTFSPNHPLLRLAARQDYLAFYQQECAERKLFHFPPFCRLVKLVFRGTDLDGTTETAQLFHRALVDHSPSPPLPPGHPKMNDLYRIQFLIKTTQMQTLTEQIASLRSLLPKNITLLVDVDPTTTYF
jgi:primosomal protein N' (replication factor Y) (superfamily II helicase)